MNENLSKEMCNSEVGSQNFITQTDSVQETKKSLNVNNAASRRLCNLSKITKVIAIISFILGPLLIILGAIQYEDDAIVLGIVLVLLAICGLINRLFIDSLVVITKNHEYKNSIIESQYEIVLPNPSEGNSQELQDSNATEQTVEQVE